MEIRMIDLLDNFDEEEGIFGDQIIVLQIDHNLFWSCIIEDPLKALGCAVQIWWDRTITIDAHLNARRAESQSNIDPFFGVLHCFGALRGLRIEKARADRGRDINYLHS